MREIKFRAWHKEEKRMYDRVLAATDYAVVTGNLWHDGELDADWKIWAISFFEIMQYTGLKDKNGKEIYEGDVVTGGVYYGWQNESGKGIVRYGEWGQDGSGGEYGSVNCLGFYLELLEQKYGYDDSTVSLVEEPTKHQYLEIIGNIYENPELLK